MPLPDLFRIRNWTTEGYAYRAELYLLAPDPMVPSATRTAQKVEGRFVSGLPGLP
ncbi:hypothetical protein ACFQ77_16635 [Streptomyces virginiae]|uniref:hypothetical protein n=1 Tax=Streptomyces virginiae TaxID=1961 RepID=UPI0036A56570